MQKALLAIGLLALTGLSGCDVWDRIVEPPRPAAVTCPCAPAQAAAEVPAPAAAPRVARHERHYAARGYAARGYRWHERYAESSVDVYGYSSGSQSYGAEYGGAPEGVPEGEGHFTGSTRVWADGYGRRHIYDQSAVAHYAYQAHMRDEQRATRLDPWHGYDDSWDE